MEELHQILHDFRKDTANLTNNVKTLKDHVQALICAREVAIAITKLQEARAWLGIALEEAGGSLMPSADKGASTTTTQPSTPTPPATPVVPQQPAQPAAPVTPTAPVAPANPGEQPTPPQV